MTKIVFIRHGETDSNKNRLFAGQTDVALNSDGIRQAEETAKKLKSMQFDAAFCGQAKRVRQTYEILCRQINFGSVFFTADIREINFGSWEGLSQAQIESEYPHEWNAYMEGWTAFSFPGGEDIRDYFSNCSRFIRELVCQYPEKTIAVIGHKGFILACACALSGQPVGRMFDVEIGNGSFFLMNSL